ncbi:S4 domain-containing protein [Cytobacillus sp. Hm23]
MNVQHFKWNLINMDDVIQEQRYCSNCGKVVCFFDTLIRRHNANGKNIYRYAIYKCEKNHTWNKKLEAYKSYTDHIRLNEAIPTDDEINTPICFKTLVDNEIKCVQISINQVIGEFRIDKVLAERLSNISRNEIVKRMKDGLITVNKQHVKPSTRIRSGDNINLLITNTHNNG